MTTKTLSVLRCPSLDVGERVELIFPFENGGLLAERPARVGLRDNFGRDHWVPRKRLNEAQAEYDKIFGPSALSVSSAPRTS